MKTYEDYYNEFREYCRTLTGAQLDNVITDERQRHRAMPEDDCYRACYQAALHEEANRSQRQGW